MCLVVLLAGLTTPKDSPQRRSHIICSHLLGSRLPPSLPPYQITDPTKHITMRVLTFAAVCMASASAFHVSMMATPASGPRFHKEVRRSLTGGRYMHMADSPLPSPPCPPSPVPMLCPPSPMRVLACERSSVCCLVCPIRPRNSFVWFVFRRKRRRKASLPAGLQPIDILLPLPSSRPPCSRAQ